MADAASSLLHRKDVRQVYVLGHSMGPIWPAASPPTIRGIQGCVAMGFPVAASAQRPSATS